MLVREKNQLLIVCNKFLVDSKAYECDKHKHGNYHTKQTLEMCGLKQSD